MVVQHNLTAMNSNRMLGITTKTQAKSTEKLSSGYKINRAADDAAGLAISEKMRKQIRGLTQASANAQDGISAVQTAEGALTEVHDMIQRMNELAVKSANGTNSQEERDYIQAEIDQLVTEIDRVAETTKFNDLYLLKGGDETVTITRDVPAVEAQAGNDLTVKYKNVGEPKLVVDQAELDKITTGLFAAGGTTKLDAAGLEKLLEIDPDDPTKYKFKDGEDIFTEAAGDNKQSHDKVAALTALKDVVSIETSGKLYSDDPTVTGADPDALELDEDDLLAYFEDDGSFVDGKDKLYDKDGNIVGKKEIGGFVNVTAKKDAVAAAEATTEDQDVSAMTLNLHVGAESSSTNKISVQIMKMDANTLFGSDGVKVSTEADATATIDKLNAGLRIVSEQRAKLGAVQNRLEHTINNLDNVVENTTAAESQIRDTDMAREMVQYANNQILAQAGQAMLAQSNQANQGVLSLLQ